MSRPLPRVIVLLAVLLLAACGGEDAVPGGRADDRASSPASRTSTPAAMSAAPGTQRQAQAAVDAAQRAFLKHPSAQYTVSFDVEGNRVQVATGAFDLAEPAYRQTYVTDGVTLELRARAGHIWTHIAGKDVAKELDGCWMQMATGTAEVRKAAALHPVGLMLVDPVATGLLGDSRNDVVVKLLLDEAAPAMMPKVVNKLGGEIDAKATVPGFLTLRDGNYASLEFAARDVINALDADVVRAAIGAVRKELTSTTVRIDYTDIGAPVDVREPDEAEVIDLGSREDILAAGEDPSRTIETCAANR